MAPTAAPATGEGGLQHWSQLLVQSCQEGVDYAATKRSLRVAWIACPRGDWMLWLLAWFAHTPEEKARVIQIAADVVRSGFVLVPDDGVSRAVLSDALAHPSVASEETVTDLVLHFKSAGDTAAAAICVAVQRTLELSRFTPTPTLDAAAQHFEWTTLAATPVGWYALACSNRDFLDTGDKAIAERALEVALKSSATFLRFAVPADMLPLSMYDPPQGMVTR